MKNKNLIYLALGLGALYFLTKKKDTSTTETTTTTSDLGNGKNDPIVDTGVVDDVADVVDTGVVDVSVPTQGGSSATVETGVITV